MKINIKALTLMLGAGVILSLTGCGGSGSSDNGTDESLVSNLGDQTINADGTITYIDYKGGERTAEATPGDAEVLAGTGYQHTLFDTAEKKCQNCHNSLYDSWKSSMHSKSWSDKIFQTKLQDFLRSHIAKIGKKYSDVADGPSEYTTDTFLDAGPTCAKCHAPAAVYSDDYKLELNEITGITYKDLNTTAWTSLKSSLENNIVGSAGWSPNNPTTVVSVGADKKLYEATYHIGHPNNREGINCATCHSIETVRMRNTNPDYGDGGTYTLKDTIRSSFFGPVVRKEGDILTYDTNASKQNMNIFFRLVGPEKYDNIAKSPHAANEFDVNKAHDGRYTFRGIDKNGTDNKTHYTGGPFYGPYGITGLDNSNEDDNTVRSAKVSPQYDKDDNNHFGDNGKALCLSCHQRSAGALVPGSNPKEFMELCTTWTAVSNGDDTNENDSMFSPKCQKCHMARVDEPTVLHQWAQPDKLFTQDDIHLTEHFDPDSTTTTGEDNPVIGKWMNDHAFVGGNKLGATNYKAKFKSGFESTLTATGGSSITVNTTLLNKTAHMFPAAHPMRRVLTRVVVTKDGVEQNVTSAYGKSIYDDIANKVVTGKSTDTISMYGEEVVDVLYNDNRVITYQGKTDELDPKDPVSSQDFTTHFTKQKATIAAPDGTVKSQYTDISGTIIGKVFNAAIIDIPYDSRFTRIYGRETGKLYDLDGNPATDKVFVVRPGFDSNIVPDQRDSRLQPNEREEYTINYTSLESGDYTVTFKVYYMQKGANGQFPVGEDGFLKPVSEMSATEKSHIVTEMATHETTVTVSNPN